MKFDARQIDPVSLLVTCHSSLLLEKIEQALHQKGFTLAYEPVRPVSTLQQALDKRIPNRLALKYGEIDDICMALLVRNRFGLIQTKRVPRAATGPDFKKIFLGSGRRYGKIREVTLRVVPRPEAKHPLSLTLRNRRHQERFLQRLLASGASPSLIQEKKNRIQLLLEGDREVVAAEARTINRILKETR